MPDAAAGPAVPPRPAGDRSPARLAVGVFVDLELGPSAGGHVKCWERLAAAAAEHPELDLAVHFLGGSSASVHLGSSARLITHRPMLDSRRLGFLAGNPDHTDLAPIHLALGPHLARCDVIHTTDAHFAFARTALSFARRHRAPLVHSTHTDEAAYAPIFTRAAVEHAFGVGRIRRQLIDRMGLDERVGRSMQRRLRRYLARCDRVLASSPKDLAVAREILPPGRVTAMRRGVDKQRFHPRWRDRPGVEARYRLPPERFIILYVGRIDDTKRPALLAEAAKILRQRGLPVHAVFVGRGSGRERIERILGADVTCLGPLPQEELPALYASVDLFALPSTTELFPNVALEAMSAGAPVLLAADGGSSQLIERDGVDGARVSGASAVDWAEAIAALQRDPERRAVMGAAARRQVERAWPSWEEVLRDDLMPVWVAAARDLPWRGEGNAWLEAMRRDRRDLP